jgi:hypothetical protein
MNRYKARHALSVGWLVKRLVLAALSFVAGVVVATGDWSIWPFGRCRRVSTIREPRAVVSIVSNKPSVRWRNVGVRPSIGAIPSARSV